jgi:hypothetical protein
METLVNGGRWAQVSYETGSLRVRVVAKALRQAGYKVSSSPLGMQVTDLGKMRLTILSIAPGSNPDTAEVQPVITRALRTLPGAGLERS